MNHVQTVQDVYAAFQRGDVAAIQSAVSETVDWRNDGVESRECPWNGDFSGKAGVPGFFQVVAEHLDFTVFDVKKMAASDQCVAVHLRIESVLRKNGRRLANDSIHLWTFDDHGQIASYRHFNDTAAELAAWRA